MSKNTKVLEKDQATETNENTPKATETAKKRKRRFGDRSDGRKLRTIPPMQKLEPYIMAKRSDSLNYYSDKINIENAEKLCRDMVKQGKNNFSILHVFLASYVRVVSQRPAINRFVSGQKVFSRNDIEVVMTVKKQMTLEAPDTCLKVKFEPTDTLNEIYEKFNSALEAYTKAEEDDSEFEKVSKIVSAIPGLLCRWAIKFLNGLDYFGIMPKSLIKVSPFHGSMIITSMGSLGVNPVYHHIYDFGNLPLFISYGAKQRECKLNEDGSIEKIKYIDIKFVMDERICDGFYYASAINLMKKLVENPEALLTPPETVIEDVD